MAKQERKLRTKGSVWEPAAVFLTAEKVDLKVLNKYIVYIQNYEYTDNPLEDSSYVLLDSTTLPKEIHSASTPPLSVPCPNDFTNATINEINAFVRSHEPAFKECGLGTTLWLVIDQEGLDNLTCILVEQDHGEDEEGKFKMLDTYKAVRIPCQMVWGTLCNLQLANMGFEDFADEDKGEGEDGLYRYTGVASYVGDEVIKKRNDVLKVMKQLGHL